MNHNSLAGFINPASTNGFASRRRVSVQQSQKSRLPQEELLKSDEDEGHRPVRPVQHDAQRKNLSPEPDEQ